MKKPRNTKAFTLIELLVVVAIIGLLASVIFASLGGARDSANVARMAQDLRTIEQAMQMWMLEEGMTSWPTESELGVGGNPTIQQIVNNTNLSEYLPQVPEAPFGNGYTYDNDGNSFSGCSASSAGVNIIVRGIDQEIRTQINEVVDSNESSVNCGKVRFFGGDEISYTLSRDGSF